MKVRKSDDAADPSYPDAKEFVKNRGVLGAAMVGAGMMLGGCEEPRRTTGVPMRTGGVIAAPSSKEVEKPVPRQPKIPVKSTDGTSGETPRLPGKVQAEPKVDPPPRLLGEVMVEPRPDPQKPDEFPVLGGVPPVAPPNQEH
ncbi:MAG: hypothetical protein WCS43_05910 [Verrucomicrobiota bacterium]